MAINPRPDVLQRFLAEGPTGPLVMLNLLRFADGGRARYAEYMAAAAPFVARVGGEVVYSGAALPALIADDDRGWDFVLLVRYPGREAFLRMVMDPAYQQIATIREAALA